MMDPARDKEMITRLTSYLPLVIALSFLLACGASPRDTTDDSLEAPRGDLASGSFAPVGPPPKPPIRIDVGESCIVEVTQGYAISGTLEGSLEIDFRILVAGPCGSPPGTFDEEWIAYGIFTGTANGTAASANLSYVAHVEAGGDVEGRIELGQGLEAELSVHGNLYEGRLSYEGWVI
jgi:hypothetical protein